MGQFGIAPWNGRREIPRKILDAGVKYAVEDWESPVSDAAGVKMVGICRKSRMREMRTGFLV